MGRWVVKPRCDHPLEKYWNMEPRWSHMRCVTFFLLEDFGTEFGNIGSNKHTNPKGQTMGLRGWLETSNGGWPSMLNEGCCKVVCRWVGVTKFPKQYIYISLNHNCNIHTQRYIYIYYNIYIYINTQHVRTHTHTRPFSANDCWLYHLNIGMARICYTTIGWDGPPITASLLSELRLLEPSEIVVVTWWIWRWVWNILMGLVQEGFLFCDLFWFSFTHPTVAIPQIQWFVAH